MTVQTNTTVATGIGNGVTSVFPIPYKFIQNEDLVVTLIDDKDGSEQKLTLNSDYTAQGAGNESGGSIALNDAPPVGKTVRIERILKVVQNTDLRNQGKFFAEVHEEAFDRIVMFIQQALSGVSQASTDLLGTVRGQHREAMAPMPRANQRAGKLLSFDGGGNPVSIAPAFDSSTALRLDLADPEKGAEMVAFKQAAENASPRWVYEKLRDIVSVADFGASPSASAAFSTVALNRAAQYAESIGAKLVGVAGEYPISGTIDINCDCDLSMMSVLANGTSIGVAVRVGKTSGTTIQRSVRAPRVKNVARPPKTWGLGVGVEVANVNAWEIYIPYVTDFEIGLDSGGYAQGTSYCDIYLGFIYDNKQNLRLKPKTENGWCNENTWFGGRLGHTPSKAPSLDPADWVGSADIAMELFDSETSVGGPNNNLFVRTSVESDRVEYMLRVCGSYNQFNQLRYEGDAKRVLLHSGANGNCHSNLFIGGYQAEGLRFTEEFGGSGVHSYNSQITGRNNKVHSSGAAFTVSTSGGGQPFFVGDPAGTKVLSLENNDPGWTYRVIQYASEYKNASNAYPRVRIHHGAGGIGLGNGSAEPISVLNLVPGGAGPGVNWCPAEDESLSLGTASRRWSQVYVASGTINTSDAREKQQVRDLTAAERATALRLKGLLRAFKFNEAVDRKGDDGARIHFGVLAQEVKRAFEEEGLVAENYAMLCYDEWAGQPELCDEEGNVTQEFVQAGSRYGVRYEELLTFIIAAG